MAVFTRVRSRLRRSVAIGELLATIVEMGLSPNEDRASRVEHAYRLHKTLKRLATERDLAEVGDEVERSPILLRMIDRAYAPPPYRVADLAHLPRTTLGGAFHHHMTSRGLDLEIFRDLPIETALQRIERRAEQSHDYLHVVTGYDTTVAGEVALAGFYIGNYTRHLSPAAGSFSVLPMILAACSMLRFALHRRDELLPMVHGFVDGWQRGHAAASLVEVEFESMWEEPLDDVRAALSIAPQEDVAPRAARRASAAQVPAARPA